MAKALILRRALLPLYIVSKIMCINPFSLNTLRPSKAGTVLTLCQGIGYAVFHLWMSKRDMSEESSKNLVRQLIDSYNRYSGFCAFCILVVTSICVQRKIVTIIRNIENVDDIFQHKLGQIIDNRTWRRNVCVQICLCIGGISIFEFRNCLMYIQDSVPFSEYCLIMCLVPMYVIGIIEMQFVAYLQLIRNRFAAINKLLGEFGDTLNQSNRYCGGITAKNGNQKFRSFEFLMSKDYSYKAGTMFAKNSMDLLGQAQLRKCNANEKNGCDAKFADKMIHIQDIYSILERTVNIVKSAFSLHLIVILIVKFTTITSLLYFCCMVIIRIISGTQLTTENEEHLVSSWAWICAIIVEMFVLCYACSATKIEANQIGCNLHKFALSVDNVYCKMKLKAFSSQLLLNELQVNPFGLFPLDLNFMYGMIGAVCTYLIILIQFDLAQKTQQKENNQTTLPP